MIVENILPVSIQMELDAAEARTGETPALRKARFVLCKLMRMSPDSVEELTAQIYKELC